MVKALEQAIAEISLLPENDQERIAGELLAHIEKLRALRGDIQAGLHSLDAGRGRELDIEDFIARARSRHERR